MGKQRIAYDVAHDHRMKSTKLKFKNSVAEEKSKSRRIKKKTETVKDESTFFLNIFLYNSRWKVADSLPNGPTLIMSTQTDTPSILFAHPESTKLSFRQQEVSPAEFEPSEVQQVFLVTLLPGSKTLYSLKAYNDKYLGCDVFGNFIQL